MMRVGLSSALGLLLALLTTGASSNTSFGARTETGAEETPVHIAISDGGVSSQTNAAGWERVRSLIRINSDQSSPPGSPHKTLPHVSSLISMRAAWS